MTGNNEIGNVCIYRTKYKEHEYEASILYMLKYEEAHGFRYLITDIDIEYTSNDRTAASVDFELNQFLIWKNPQYVRTYVFSTNADIWYYTNDRY